ncbi:MAG TPA: hypothetical protein DEP64_00400, partial [Ruminococcaceae bacterium]|nr:hypothetical protein [Oscillospiraceae bacterium]
MKTGRKVVGLLLCAALAVGVAGCSNGGGKPAAGSAPAADSTGSTAQENSAEKKSGGPITVGFSQVG